MARGASGKAGCKSCQALLAGAPDTDAVLLGISLLHKLSPSLLARADAHTQLLTLGLGTQTADSLALGTFVSDGQVRGRAD